MGKKKQKTRLPSSRGFGQKNLAKELERAEVALADEDWQKAERILRSLADQFPAERRVWEYLSYVGLQLEDVQLCQLAFEHRLAFDPDDADLLYALGTIYLGARHPMLALKTLRQALEQHPQHEDATKTQELVTTLEKGLQELLQTIGLSEAEGWEIILLHERGQALLESGNLVEARQAEVEVLERLPTFVSAANNLSLIDWMEGNAAAAIATAESILEKEPDNIHALSNLVHFHCLVGDLEAAQAYGKRLQASHADAWDAWTKKAEALAYLKDDEALVALSNEVEMADLEGLAENPLFYHLVAVAMARTGKQREAKSFWKRALKANPAFTLAQENLKDFNHPTSLQHGAWPFSWEQWLTPLAVQQLRQTMQQIGNSTKSVPGDSKFQRFLETHPALVQQAPTLLERGGPQAQEMLVQLAEYVDIPELMMALKDFALSQNGTDQLRNQAAVRVAQAGFLPKDNVRLWLKGQWQKISLMAYEFYDEPEEKYSKKVNRWLEQGTRLLRSSNPEDAEQAERILQKALAVEPDAPDILNNLAAAYMVQGRKEEATDLVKRIAADFPDYLFGQISLAKIHLYEHDIETAEALLKPILRRERFHFSELAAFADAYIELLMAQKNKDGARAWV